MEKRNESEKYVAGNELAIATTEKKKAEILLRKMSSYRNYPSQIGKLQILPFNI